MDVWPGLDALGSKGLKKGEEELYMDLRCRLFDKEVHKKNPGSLWWCNPR